MSDSFKKNLQILSKLNPEVAKLLASFQPTHFNPRSSNFTLPSLSNEKVLYIFGLSEAVYKCILKPWLQEDPTRICVFLENELEALYSLLNSDNEKLLKDPQCYLFTFQVPFTEELAKKLAQIFYKYDYYLLPIEEYEEKKSLFSNIETQLSFWYTAIRSIAAEYENAGSAFFNNYYSNINFLPQSYQFEGFKDQFKGVPAIICGAGPSLDKNLPLLETLADKALIFAGGTAMNAVNSKGFLPHFGVGIDPNIEQFSRLIMNTAYETPFIYRGRLFYQILPLVQGPKLFVSGSPGYEISKWFEKNLEIEGSYIDEGYNVVNFSLSLASHMGCNPIIFVGLDLAYSDQKSYQSGVISHPTHIKKKDFKTKTHLDELLVKNDIYGQPTYTLWKWLAESAWISQFAVNAADRLFINATEGGIGMQNIINMPLKEVVDNVLIRPSDLYLSVHGHIQSSQMPNTVNKENIENLSQKLILSLIRCEEVSSSLYKACFDQNEQYEELYNLLKQEIGYQYVLKNFEEHYENKMAFEKLKIDHLQISDEEKKLKKLTLNAELFPFLQNIAKVNGLYIKFSILFNENLNSVETASFEKVNEDNEYLKFIQNTQHPPILHFYDNGKIKFQQFYVNNQLHGPCSFFSRNGNLLGRSWFKKGKREGKTTLYYHEGPLYAIQNYKEGQKEGEMLYYFPNGKIKSLIRYKNNLLDGEIKLYYSNGELKRLLNFKEGKREGFERMWTANKTLQMEVEYKENIPQGIAKTWYPDGLIAQEITYKDGVVLSVKRWDNKGLLISEKMTPDEDFFDKVTLQTEIFSHSLENVFNELSKLAPHLINEEKENYQKDFSELEKEFKRLNEINKELQMETGVHADSLLEPIWKSPSTKQELNQELQNVTQLLSEELKNIQILLDRLKPN